MAIHTDPDQRMRIEIWNWYETIQAHVLVIRDTNPILLMSININICNEY
jgi:hypothetical protein